MKKIVVWLVVVVIASIVIGYLCWHNSSVNNEINNLNNDLVSGETEVIEEDINTEYTLLTVDNKKVILNEDIKLFDKEPISTEEGRGDGYHWNDYVYDDIEIHAIFNDDGKEMCNRITTTSTNYRTTRGAKVGDSLEVLSELYPDDLKKASTYPWSDLYIYEPQEVGFNRIYFTLENDIITKIMLENGIDG